MAPSPLSLLLLLDPTHGLLPLNVKAPESVALASLFLMDKQMSETDCSSSQPLNCDLLLTSAIVTMLLIW